MDTKIPDIIRNRAKTLFKTDAIDVCYPPTIYHMADTQEFRTYEVIVTIEGKKTNYTVLACPKDDRYSDFTKSVI